MWTVAQIGAREHYFAARSFHARGQLATLYTDLWCGLGRGLLRRGPANTRALAGRFHPDIPHSRVVAFNKTALIDRLLREDRRPERFYEECLRIGRWFDLELSRQLRRRPLDPSADAFFSFNTGCLASLRLLRDGGVYTVVDQVDPARVEYEITKAEAAKWPGWDLQKHSIPEVYFERLAAEWEAASVVVVNSPWSAQALVAQQVPAAKIAVVPLFFDPRTITAAPRRQHSNPLVVLWLGLVVLRKGIPYLIEAARQLQDRNIRFDIVGNIIISEQAVRSAPPNVRFLGRYSREQTADAYRSADLFVLPTLSDGFAITQLEAMAHGLPVIATPNCGQVVEPEKDGLIVPPADSDALASAIARFDDDRSLLPSMSANALEKSRRFRITAFADQMENDRLQRRASV